ncbi:hypothetical protein BDV95DRAFT_606500 [Massariosphaeria phaeospora]|uniref:FAD/NAD(P)-binding domain-containing protein n=1 Tax=Massariosphaeria phaeospora TaxID=100035 RepID=A0A7C8IA48_9PLEO|nr:hypothetical protein BDV95DRAFT_606500 [Massariosphaeria phaeospora]
MSQATEPASLSDEYPRKADLRNEVSRPLPKVTPGTIDPATMTGDAPITQARAVLDALNSAIASNDAEKLAECFYAEQAYWRDIVALTSHLRTLTMPGVIAAALLHLISLRGLEGRIELVGDAHFAVVSPVLMFIDCEISFRINSPALDCMGKMVLLPVKTNESVCWKIWVLSTWVEKLMHHPEDESLLLTPGRRLTSVDAIETEVLIIGGGTSGLMTAARLKALGVESVVLDRNAQVGDSWAQRYDSLRFHVPTSNFEMPYTYYKKELQSPHRLTKCDVVEHLNIILSAAVQSSFYRLSEKKWTVRFKSLGNSETRTIVSKHLVQATGLGSGKPYLPPMEDTHVYQGFSVHSAEYRNAKILAERGVESVAIIGSANTAFDVMQDCYEAGLKTTMVARSPTYIFPYDYVMDPHGVDAYDAMPLDAADRLLNTFPSALDGRFSHGLFAHLASQEPDRYLALSKAGFPVLDSTNPSVNVQHHLLERGGGHYLDVGGTDLISEGKVSVRGRVEPVGYTETGLRLSDHSVLDVDAVIWCTGFADKDVRVTAREMLGAEEAEADHMGVILGPADIAARLDASWGVDAEGEVRGVWKRHLRMENYWVIGGVIQHQRWWSRPLAQQIKLALDGSLPPAYRDTPVTE